MVKLNFSTKLKNRIKQRILNKILKSFKTEGNPFTNKKFEVESKLSLIEESTQEKQESLKDHFFTFQLYNDLFTLLYSTLVFKWVQTDRVN
jgi:hypothetical protein